MNIKNIRKNYDKLSLRERLILLDSAEWRDDESEIHAIVSASPKEGWRICDFVEPKEKIKTLRLLYLIGRLKHIINTLFYLELSNNFNEPKDEFFFGSARLEAYFYVVSEKAEASIFAEIGLDNQKWLDKEKELFDLTIIDEIADGYIKQLSFTEDEAREFIQCLGKEKGFKNIKLGFTVENEIKRQKATLKDCGLSALFKD